MFKENIHKTAAEKVGYGFIAFYYKLCTTIHENDVWFKEFIVKRNQKMYMVMFYVLLTIDFKSNWASF